MVRLDRLINQARRRIQRERILKGTAIVLTYLLVAAVISSWVLASSNFSSGTIFWCRVSFGAGLLLLLWRFILDPIFRPPAPGRVARFLEERNPELQQRLSTAVEVSRQPSLIHPDLARLIEEDAYRHLSRREQPRFYWPRFSLASALVGALSLLITTGLLFWGPGEFRYGLGKLLGSWVDDTSAPLYEVLVEPGNTKVAERADVEVSAIPKGFEPQSVQIFALYPNTPQWQSTRMLADEGAAFRFLFFDVREPIEYYVDADGIRSQTFRIEVADIPRVERVRITLQFPKYTGLSEVVLDDETYVRALRGTRVIVQAHADQPSPAGVLKFEESGREIPLQKVGSNDFEASFEIDQDDYFRISLESGEGILNPASDEFTVEAIQDQPPSISFNYPGRDRPVTNIEEVYSEVRAEDDYGLRSVTLNFSVNGGPDQSIDVGSPRGTRDFTGSHTFYLEEYELQPGDFISYYARAADAVSESTTDIFFLEVENFDREFRQSQMNMGGGEAGQRGLELSRQQKQIVVAAFSLVEDGRPTPEEMTEDSQTLALVQQRLQAQAQTIVDRIERRGVTEGDARFRSMAEYMRQAIEHMGPSETALNAVNPEGALPEAKKALQNLLRAEKLFNEVQVSMSNSSEGGASPEELADLVDLELDRTKNQYETLQKNRQEQKDQQLDEALEKLKELARRQEQELERQRRQAASGQGGSQASQQDLIEEMERLSRELARLSRDKANEQLSRISRELNRAARDLRNAQASGKDSAESMERARQALERLKQAQEGLSNQRQSEIEQQMAELSERAEQMVEAQQEVVEDLRSIPAPPERGEPSDEYFEGVRDLYWKKQGLQKDLQELESQLHQTARRLESDEPEASRRLKSAGLQIRDQRIPDKMREGSELLAGGLLPFAERREQDVAQELERLAEKVAEAREGLGASPQGQEDKLRQALGEAGKLVENLESMKRKLEQASRQQASGSETGEGKESEQQSGQPGSQPGSREPGQGSPGQSAQNQPSQSEQQGQEPGQGAQGTAPRRSEMAGGFSSQGIDPGNLRCEWQQRVEEAERLQQALGGADPELRREATRLLQQMLQADLDRILDDPGEVAQLKASVIDGFHELELLISRSLEDEKADYLRPVNQDEVPPEFRDRVDEYYRRLSSSRNP